MIKKLGILIAILLCTGVLSAQDQGQGQEQGQEQEQAYQPLLASVSNSVDAQNDMLANTYQLLVIDKHMPDGSVGMGGATAFRLHKNWFLTCAHGPF